MAAIAKRAVGDLVELRSLSGAVVLIEASYARCLDDLDALLEKGVPVARRRDGWRFLLADAEDMQRLNRVTLDGETVLAQMAGKLVDVSALSWASEVADVLAPQVAQFHHLLESTGAERVEDLGIPATIL